MNQDLKSTEPLREPRAAPITAGDDFTRGGFARLAHFQSPMWSHYREELESTSRVFGSLAWGDGPGGYPWPLDPLHWWSRIWEYPFFAAHLANLAQPGARPRLLDIGAAVTFFTLYMRAQGLEVLSMDADPAMAAHFARVYHRVAPALGLSATVPPYLIAEARETELPGESFDVLTCVSVLEHIPGWELALQEMKRLLRVGGHLVLTFDVNLTPESNGFTLDEVGRLLDCLAQDMEPLTAQDREIPDDVLHMTNSPCVTHLPRVRRSILKGVWPPTALPGKISRRLRRLRHPPAPATVKNLCVYGGVWRKR